MQVGGLVASAEEKLEPQLTSVTTENAEEEEEEESLERVEHHKDDLEGQRSFVHREGSKEPGESIEGHYASDADHEADGGSPLLRLGHLETRQFAPLLVAEQHHDDDDKHHAVEEDDDHDGSEEGGKESHRVTDETAVQKNSVVHSRATSCYTCKLTIQHCYLQTQR